MPCELHNNKDRWKMKLLRAANRLTDDDGFHTTVLGCHRLLRDLVGMHRFTAVGGQTPTADSVVIRTCLPIDNHY